MLIDAQPLYFIYVSEYYWTDRSNDWSVLGVVMQNEMYYASNFTITDGVPFRMSDFIGKTTGDILQIVTFEALKRLLIARGVDTSILTKLKKKAGVKR